MSIRPYLYSREESNSALILVVHGDMALSINIYVMYKFQLVQRVCTGCNLYKQFVQVATRTRLAVQVATCTEFHRQIIPTLDLKRILVKLTLLLKIFLIFVYNYSN